MNNLTADQSSPVPERSAASPAFGEIGKILKWVMTVMMVLVVAADVIVQDYRELVTIGVAISIVSLNHWIEKRRKG